MILVLADYKRFLNIESTDTDDILTDVIESAEAEVEAFIRFDLESASHTDTVDGQGTSFIVLDHTPVTAVTSISYWDGDSWVALVDGDDYVRMEIKDGATIYLDSYTFAEGTSNYRIVYTAGYSTIPYDLQLGMKKLVRLRWDETPFGANRFGVSSKSNQGGVQSNANFDLDTEEKVFRSIEKYAHVNV